MPSETEPKPGESAAKRSPMLWYAAIFVSFVCAALLTMEGWFASNTRNSTLTQTQISVANLSRALAQQAEDAINRTDTVLFGLVERIEADGVHALALQPLYPLLAAQVGEMPQLEGVYIVDQHGRWVVNSRDDVPPPLDNSEHAYFRYHREHADRKPYVGAAMRSGFTGEWVIPVSRRLNHPDGSFAGVLMASIRVSYFVQYYGRFNIGNQGAIVLTLDDGLILARRPYKEALIGAYIGRTVGLMELAKKYGNGMVYARSDIDGIERVVGYQHLGAYPLVAIAALSKDEALASWRSATLRQVLAVLFLTALTALLGLRLVRQIGMHDRIEQALSIAQEKVIAANKTLQHMALQDGLTGLANRRQFDLTLTSEFDRAMREQRPIALLMIDVDYFKRYNDTYGHPAGDICLRRVANQLHSRRPGDFTARYGGEEFVVILANTDLTGAMVVAQAMRAAVRDLQIPHSGNPSGLVTVSIGVHATIPATFGKGASAFVQAADKALYVAKSGGRDMVSALHGDIGDGDVENDESA